VTVALFAAEQSGDQLGAGILPYLQKPTFGMGGPNLQKAGMELLYPTTDVMGVTDVLLALPCLLQRFYRIKKDILTRQPSAVITIDAPDFFLPLHRALRKAGYRGKLIHLVSPSVWAWRPGRIHTMAQTLDLLITLLPFEAAYYAKTPLPVSYVGHPLAYHILHQSPSPLPCQDLRPILALFPGSRSAEIKRNLQLQLEAAQGFPHHQHILCLAREDLRPLVPSSLHTVMADQRYALMQAADCAFATSGTVCLELALHGVPTAVTYTLSSLNYFLGRYVFRIHMPHFTLPNLILGCEMLPEHFDTQPQPQEIATTLQRVLQKPDLYQALTTKLRSHFDIPCDPYQKSAEAILHLLNKAS